METLVAHVDRVVAAQWVTTICDSNPASPISRYSGETVLSEEVPGGWWDSWFFQRATESLQKSIRYTFCGFFSFFLLFSFTNLSGDLVANKNSPLILNTSCFKQSLVKEIMSMKKLNVALEPSTFALIGIGALALMVAHRRKVAQ